MASARLWGSLGATIVLVGVFGACGKEDVNPTPTGGGGSGTTSSTSSSGGAGGMAPSGVTIPGLSGPVTAVYDENGLLHLSCQSDDDCYAALGYFHAQNRFFFMDFIRNLVRGSLGSLVKAGDLVLQKDYANRQWFSTRDGTPLEQKLYDDASAPVKGYMDAYTRGVNAWIADMRAGRNDATLTTEYDFGLIVKSAIRDWEAVDCAAIGLYVLDDLSNNSGAELALGQEAPLFSTPLATDLFTSKPVFDVATVSASTLWANPPHDAMASTQARLAPFSSLLGRALDGQRLVGSGGRISHPGDIGSNDWVVGPTHTSAGHALLANDPHLLLSNPSIWFPAELDAKSAGKGGTFHVAGSTFPGLPAVMVGRNESIAWGVTTAYYDLADVYLEKLTPDGKNVIFNGQNVPIFEKSFVFQDAKGGVPITKTFRWVPHHGPIVSEDTTAHTAVSIRWTAHDGGTDLDGFFGIANAGTVDEAKQALTKITSASQNFVVIDKQGNIGWFPYSQVPNRPWASAALPPWAPVPGDGTAEWQGTVPIASLPQLTNPVNGFIATANADMTGASFDGDVTNDGNPAFQSWDKADGTREQRIVDLIKAGGDTHSVQTMHDIQGDTRSLYGGIIVPLALTAAQTMTKTSDEQAVVDALTAWQYTCPTGLDGSDPMTSAKTADPAIAAESIGCTAFHTFLTALVNDAVGDEAKVANVTLGATGVELVARALKDPTQLTVGDDFWDDVSTVPVETRDDILRKAITDAAAVLGPMGAKDEWRWGRYHTISLRSIYDSFGLASYNYGPFAAPGGLYTVNVASPDSRTLPTPGTAPDFSFSHGPSIRFVVEARSDGLDMSYELPGGADLHKTSPFYNNLLPNWLINKPIPFPFGPGAVTTPAKTVAVAPGK